MSDDANYYVYEHIRPDTGAVFYVGKGRRGRAWRMDNRNPWHKRITAKMKRMGIPVEVRIVARGLTEREAFDLEIELIAGWSVVYELVNQTSGGEGASDMAEEARMRISAAKKGVLLTEEHKAKLSAAHMGKVLTQEHKDAVGRAAKGRKHTDEARAKIAKAKKGVPLSEEHRKNIANINIGRKHSDETKALWSAQRKGKKHSAEWIAKIRSGQPGSRQVRCLDDGKVYASVAEAARAIGAPRANIIKVCQGQRRLVLGYRFEYAE